MDTEIMRNIIWSVVFFINMYSVLVNYNGEDINRALGAANAGCAGLAFAFMFLI